MIGSGNEEGLIDSRMIQVMNNGGNNGRENLERCELFQNPGFLKKAVHSLRDVSRMNSIVVRISPVIPVLDDS